MRRLTGFLLLAACALAGCDNYSASLVGNWVGSGGSTLALGEDGAFVQHDPDGAVSRRGDWEVSDGVLSLTEKGHKSGHPYRLQEYVLGLDESEAIGIHD